MQAVAGSLLAGVCLTHDAVAARWCWHEDNMCEKERECERKNVRNALELVNQK
jgi:hypothetical protein